jgi:hypothetical protein
MKTETLSPTTEAAVWLRILHPDGKLTPAVARALLQLSLPRQEKDRMHKLSAKARSGTLTGEEEGDMETFERVGALLSTLKSKARQVLKEAERGSQ